MFIRAGKLRTTGSLKQTSPYFGAIGTEEISLGLIKGTLSVSGRTRRLRPGPHARSNVRTHPPSDHAADFIYARGLIAKFLGT